ncbi:uncharacterized protein LOC9659548 [Selaginella moellendorffii]|nr:uncharacterized protein LOC9659548 [Selaginella moellendorffii]|eukprot:XP_002979048.2 uncharacterized protein LOC9659548 [Selaginella moellendorffii]
MASMAPDTQQELFSEPEFEGDEGQIMSAIVVDPEPFVSTQFYTFNRASHQLMVQCVLAKRYAHPEEIKLATPTSILSSWRAVWKDRHEDTAYQTGWKRIQDKLHAQVDEHGNELLYFKSNPQQFVPYIDQWQEIVQGFHADADLKHLGLKDTIDRIKQVWTVGAKFYGIPESYVRVCVSACPVCNSEGDHNGLHKRRRFEYTETMELLAKDVPHRLQQLAAKYKVILCIRQKYIRYKPFLAEVKDYCCHRAGEPNVKKTGKKKTNNKFISNRCGCGFRIRAIVPITNYSYKDKSFTYQEEGSATFKLYPVHSGHDPGPQESTGMVINQLIDSTNMTEVSGLLLEKVTEEAHASALRKVRELRAELASLEGRITRIPFESLGSIGQELQSVSLKLKASMSSDRGDDRLAIVPVFDAWQESLGKDKPEFASDVMDSLQKRRKAAKKIVHNKSPTKAPSPPAYEQRPKECGALSEADDSSLAGMPVDGFYPDAEKWYVDQGPDCADDLAHRSFRHSIA